MIDAIQDTSVDMVKLEKEKNLRRGSNRFHLVGRNHHPGPSNRAAGTVRDSGGGSNDDCAVDDDRRLRFGGFDRQTRRCRPISLLAEIDLVLVSLSRGAGRLIIVVSPYLLRTLSIAGTVAMFMVGGGIITTAFPLSTTWYTTGAKPSDIIHTSAISWNSCLGRS